MKKQSKWKKVNFKRLKVLIDKKQPSVHLSQGVSFKGMIDKLIASKNKRMNRTGSNLDLSRKNLSTRGLDSSSMVPQNNRYLSSSQIFLPEGNNDLVNYDSNEATPKARISSLNKSQFYEARPKFAQNNSTYNKNYVLDPLHYYVNKRYLLDYQPKSNLMNLTSRNTNKMSSTQS